jgi:hypothetical protein
MELIEKVKQRVAEIEAKRSEMLKDLQQEFPDLLKGAFEKHPTVESVACRQYTPYFNDGDECTFGASLGYDDIYVNGKNYWDEGKEERDLVKPMYQDFATILLEIPEEFYKDLFGDHVEVKINRDGTVETEEYEHG